MDLKTLTTPEIIKAILARDDVAETVTRLIRQKETELHKYKDSLNKEEESTRLLVEALELPQGTAGRDIADAIIAELRERYPDIAKAADERIAAKKKAEQEELDRICAR
ncbi:MAG: hypothetical protein IJ181_12765 [Acidaminococcaceae bacterium]|nr:hypothetical protein [Acidaminococcaceae bacterium]